jgi:predicted  nucleic acid-binding Zn-ribbon protein
LRALRKDISEAKKKKSATRTALEEERDALQRTSEAKKDDLEELRRGVSKARRGIEELYSNTVQELVADLKKDQAMLKKFGTAIKKPAMPKVA